jgi:hypothetical protein
LLPLDRHEDLLGGAAEDIVSETMKRSRWKSIPSVFIDITMRLRTTLTSRIVLALLHLLQEAAAKQACPTKTFQFRFYARWEDKYLLKYRGKNSANPDILDKSMNSYMYDWGVEAKEAKGRNGTSQLGGLYIERDDITNEQPFEIHFSEKIPSGEIPLFAPEVYGQSLKVSFFEPSAPLH